MRAEIQRLSGTVPKDSFQKWGAVRSAEFKKTCVAAQKLAAKAAATEQQLNSMVNQLRGYWA